jgi:hypothetical protein
MADISQYFWNFGYKYQIYCRNIRDIGNIFVSSINLDPQIATKNEAENSPISRSNLGTPSSGKARSSNALSESLAYQNKHTTDSIFHYQNIQNKQTNKKESENNIIINKNNKGT